MDAFTRPPPHGQISGWLGSQTIDRLLDFARANRDRFKPAGVYHDDGAGLDPGRRIADKTAIPEFAGEIEARMRDCLADIFAATGTQPFEPGRFEIELVAHGDGAFFKRHIDSAVQAGPRARVISAVYYFFREPKAFRGGELRLHSVRPGTFVDVEPVRDMLVFFPSWFPHEVLPVSCPTRDFMDARFAINCWVRS